MIHYVNASSADAKDRTMPDSSSPASLLVWLNSRFNGQVSSPPCSSQKELADVAERLVQHHLKQDKPLRPAAVAKKLATLSLNLKRAAKAASQLGEQGMSHVLLASNGNGAETADALHVIDNLQDLAVWSTQAANTAQSMNLSADDHKGGRTPDARLRSLVTVLMDRYEFLLGIKASHTEDPITGLGHSTFDLFVKEAIRLHAPEGIHFEPHQIDDAISRALSSRASNFWS